MPYCDAVPRPARAKKSEKTASFSLDPHLWRGRFGRNPATELSTTANIQPS
jgi:hypothetical protein